MRIGLSGVMTLAAALFATVQPAAAQGGGALTSKIELQKVVPGTGTDRHAELYTFVAPDVVVPGDRIRVTLTFTNNGTAPASGVNIVNPIPEGLVFDGANDPAAFSVSVDGAKAFGALDALTVPVEGAAPRAAANADVTHVRWLWPDAIPVGGSRSVAFFGRVK
ncbi:DUF11 domain-containing protein [Sphingopyxis macrogoltabida]|nr:DUF11 domain-containing protein [Sphingopyxis macrogoltabida]ALJ14294.1 hypothetical protein LH19_15595 [Sphingopyxis macrogoltabida]